MLGNPVDAPPPPEWDARAGSPLRGALVLPLLLLFAFGLLVPLSPLGLLAPSFLARTRRAIIHAWGRGVLALLGIELCIEGAERIPASGPAIVLFTHQNVIDLAVLAALWPPRGVVLYKREFHRIPFMGSAMKALGMIAVDRQDHEAARRSVALAAERLRREQAQVMMAPEGTRSPERRLLPFKRGAFHLALASGAPMVPLILQGLRQVLPRSSLFARPGRIRALFLEPIDSRQWSSDSLDRHVREVRAVFLRHVPDSPSCASRARTRQATG